MLTRLVLAASLVMFSSVACDGPGSEDPDEITGVVTEVESSGLTEVESFTVKEDDASYEILIDSETELAFPPAHLNEHRVSGEPVTVSVESRAGKLYALSVEDG